MNDLPTLHLINCFHTVPDMDRFSHCAFTGKCFRFPKMMKPFGYKTVMYANEGDLSEADEKVVMLTKAEFDQHYPQQKPHEFHGDYAKYGTKPWAIFDGRLREQLAKRLGPHDLILHPFGHAHRDLVKAFPHHIHVESGIGYNDAPFGAWRIYESSAWLHWHLGRYEQEYPTDRGMTKAYSFVIPNYFDLEDWPYYGSEENKDYVVFLGRITPSKGTRTIAEIIRIRAEMKMPIKFVFAGQGDFEKEVMAHVLRDPKPDEAYIDVEYLGPVTGRRRAKLVGQARCAILASEFIEPFAGSVVESALTGTPGLGVSYGAFRETIVHGVTGFNCITIGDWLTAIEESKKLDRRVVANRARSLYSLETCGRQYDEAFRVFADQYTTGWNTRTSHRIHSPPSKINLHPELPVEGSV